MGSIDRAASIIALTCPHRCDLLPCAIPELLALPRCHQTRLVCETIGENVVAPSKDSEGNKAISDTEHHEAETQCDCLALIRPVESGRWPSSDKQPAKDSTDASGNELPAARPPHLVAGKIWMEIRINHQQGKGDPKRKYHERKSQP